jgi:hypothetical protein
LADAPESFRELRHAGARGLNLAARRFVVSLPI